MDNANSLTRRSFLGIAGAVPLAVAAASRLQAAAGRRGTVDPDELCDRLLADLAGTHRADDIALLALTRHA